VLLFGQIGENEKAYSNQNQEAVESDFERAMPFRDPGHISRDQIRFDRALKDEGVVAHGPGWSWQQPLWGKYHQVMKDPSEVEAGWTGGRSRNEDAAPMQRAMEQYAYGSEGHRQPTKSWAPGVDVHYDPDQDQWTDEGEMKPAARGGDTELSALEKQMAVLSQSVSQLKHRPQHAEDVSKELTYKVMRDKLVHSRLEAEVAAAKEQRAEQRGERELHEQMQRLREVKSEEEDSVSSLKGTVEALRAKVSKLTHGRASRFMSDRDARKDLASYFKKLQHDTVRAEAHSARSKLATFNAAPAHKGRRDAARPSRRDARMDTYSWDRAEDAPGHFKHMRLKAGMEQLADVRSQLTAAEDKGSRLSQLIRSLARSNNKEPFLPGLK
jgi:hypothetical protein